MKLSKVRLVGFRSHHSTEVLLQDYTCIIGRNDCGKSAFLRALRLLLDPRVRPTEEDLSKIAPLQAEACIEAEFTDVPATWPIGIDSVLKLRRRVAGTPLQWEVQGMVAVEPELRKMAVGQATKGGIEKSETISADIKAELGAMPAGTLKPDQWVALYNSIDAKGLVAKELDWGPVPDTTITNLFQVVFLAADSKAEDEIGGSKSAFDDLGGMLIREAAKSNHEIAAKTAELQVLLNALVEKDEEGKWAYSPLNKMEEILKSEISLFDKDISLVHQSTAPSLGDHRFGMTLDVEDPYVKGIGNMGHGLRRSLIFAMLRTFVRMPEIVASLNEEAPLDGAIAAPEPFKLFLIEEPELYLHPQAERVRMLELQELATKPHTQVVLCTHSAFFVDLQEHRSIVRFTRDNRSKTEVFGWAGTNLTPGEKAWLLTVRYFDGGATAMLFADCAVLCEGATEKLCVPKLASALALYNPAFEIVDCNGADHIETYQKVLESLHVPYVIWIDGDEDKPEAKLVANNRITQWKALRTAIGVIVVNRHDWEDAAGMPHAGREKPLKSWTKFVANGDACTAPLENAIRAVYERQDLDMRTP
ncbi:hypothetical protein C0431_15615 [bacterium]|nr:hypothetical protein [bacterium]